MNFINNLHSHRIIAVLTLGLSLLITPITNTSGWTKCKQWSSKNETSLLIATAVISAATLLAAILSLQNRPRRSAPTIFTPTITVRGPATIQLAPLTPHTISMQGPAVAYLP